MWHVTKGKGSETPVPPQAVTQNGHLNNLCLRGKMVQVCVVESLCCSPETIITLLICYTPTQDKKLKKKVEEHKVKKKKQTHASVYSSLQSHSTTRCSLWGHTISVLLSAPTR